MARCTKHVEAIASLILADRDRAVARYEARILAGKRAKLGPNSWTFAHLTGPVGACERLGLITEETAILVCETMKSSAPGHGYPFPPVKRLTPAMRQEVAAIITARGLPVTAKKIAGTWVIAVKA